MKIIYERVPVTTLQKFVEKNNLSILVSERKNPVDPTTRFYARIPHSEVSDGHVLRGVFGNGATEYEAIRNYVPEISGKRLKVDDMYIDVPVLLPYASEEAVGNKT
jgi:hypothetical protein